MTSSNDTGTLVGVLSDIIQKAHSDALFTETWSEILRMIGRIVAYDAAGAVFANIQTGRLETRITQRVGAQFYQWYDAHYPAIGVIADTAATRGLSVWRPSDVIGKQEWEASKIHNDLLSDFGLGEPVCITCGSAGQTLARFWFIRGKNKDDYADGDIHILRLLQSHFCNALRLGKALLEGNAYREAFQQALHPKFICDSSGKITEMNTGARQLVEDADGKTDGFLDRVESIACGLVARHADCELVEMFGQRYRFSLSPVVSPHVPTAYVLVVDSADYLCRALSLSMLACGFSKREVEVGILLIEGMSNQQIAKKLFIEECTVKDHVTRIFQKLGISRRSGVVPRLLGF